MNDNPESVPTEGTPQVPPPYRPQPGAGTADSTEALPAPGDGAPTVPHAPVPPAPGAGGPPGFPQGPPIIGQPYPGRPGQVPGQAPLGQPPVGQPPAGEPRKSRTGLVLVIVLVVVVALAGLAALAIASIVSLRSSAARDLSVERCEIAADGTMTAEGTVGGFANGEAVQLMVTFVDLSTGDVVDTASTSVDISFAGIGGVDRWNAAGSAGDDVQRIRCDVEAAAG